MEALPTCRPIFLSITVTTLLGNFLRYKNRRRTALAVAVAFGLTVTPEIIQLYNQNRLPTFKSLITRTGHDKAQDLVARSERIFSVSGLKCQACCARLKRHILEHAAVEHCNVDFDRGEIQIRGSSLQNDELVRIIQTLGYSAQIIKETSNGTHPGILVNKVL